MTEKTDHSSTLKSYSILGSSTVITMVLSLVRVKVIALLLGPAGIGLLGLLQNVMTTASTLISLGIDSAGTKQIAEHVGKGDQKETDATRMALFWGTMLLAVLGGSAVFFLRDFLAEIILGDVSLSSTVGWMGVGVTLSIAASSQSSLITGMRRVGDIAKIQILSSLMATTMGLSCIWAFGMRGLIFHIIAAPLAALFISQWFISKLPKVNTVSSMRMITEQWNSLVRLGFAMMLASLIAIVSQLIVRSIIQNKLGTVELGYFQASWGLSMIYLSFILAVLGTDYYPKLAGMIHDKSRANALVNQQTEVALMMAAPFILIMMGFLPWIIHILYSSEFEPAANILRWYVLADVLKIASTPLRFVILSAGHGRTYVLLEAISAIVFSLSTWLLIPFVGIESAGIAFLIMFIIYSLLIFYVAEKLTGISWNVGTIQKFSALFVFVLLIFFIREYNIVVAVVVSILGVIAFLAYSVKFFIRSGSSDILVKSGLKAMKFMRDILNSLSK